MTHQMMFHCSGSFSWLHIFVQRLKMSARVTKLSHAIKTASFGRKTPVKQKEEYVYFHIMSLQKPMCATFSMACQIRTRGSVYKLWWMFTTTFLFIYNLLFIFLFHVIFTKTRNVIGFIVITAVMLFSWFLLLLWVDDNLTKRDQVSINHFFFQNRH